MSAYFPNVSILLFLLILQQLSSNEKLLNFKHKIKNAKRKIKQKKLNMKNGKLSESVFGFLDLLINLLETFDFFLLRDLLYSNTNIGLLPF